MFLFLAQTSAVGHSTARSLTVKEGWHGPEVELDLGMFWTVKKKMTMSQMGMNLTMSVDYMSMGYVSVQLYLTTYIKINFISGFGWWRWLISNMHWRVTWMNGRLVGWWMGWLDWHIPLTSIQNQLFVQTSIEPNPGAQTKDACMFRQWQVAGVIPAWMMFSVRVNVLATILLQTSLFPKWSRSSESSMAHFSLLFQFEAQPARTSSPGTYPTSCRGWGWWRGIDPWHSAHHPNCIQCSNRRCMHSKVPRQTCQGKHSLSSSSALTSSDSARSFKM